MESESEVKEQPTSAQQKVADWRLFKPNIDLKVCQKNYRCVVFCPHNAIQTKKDGYPVVNAESCTGCLICLRECPTSAITEEREQ